MYKNKMLIWSRNNENGIVFLYTSSIYSVILGQKEKNSENEAKIISDNNVSMYTVKRNQIHSLLSYLAV